MNIVLLISLLFIVIVLHTYDYYFSFTYIFSFFWFVNMIISEIFFAQYKFSLGLYVLVLSSVLFCFAGEVLGLKRRKSKQKMPKLIYRKFKIVFWAFFIFAILFPVVYLLENGISLIRLLSFQSLLEINNEMAVARYTGETATSLLTQFCLIFVYALPLYTSLSYRFHLKKKYLFIALLPSVAVLLTQNTKLVLMSTLLTFLAGIITASIVCENKIPRVKIRTVIYGALGFILFYILMLFSFVARIGRFDEEAIVIANSKVASYVAHMPALDNWLRHTNINNISYTYGTKTFFGISNALGIADRKAGVFTEFFVFKDSGQSFSTNIYTAYRFLIEDFGLAWSMLFFLFVSFIFALIRQGSAVIMKLTVMTMLMFFVFNSYVTPVWAYFSYIAAFFLLYFALKLSFKL